MTQYGFYFDQSRCYSCHDCAIACKDWNGIEAGPEKWMTVYEWEEGCFPALRVRSLAFPCAHCEDPACLKACPQGAIFKEERYGAVLVDSEKCDGCRSCYEACPYGAPKFASDEPGTKMSKCTMCIDKLEKGEAPACVGTCPLRAFDFGPIEELEAKYGTLRQLDGMPSPEATQPCFIVKPATDHKQVVPYDVDRAMELMQKRTGFADLFENVADVTGVESGVVRSDCLKMKHENAAALQAATQNYAG